MYPWRTTSSWWKGLQSMIRFCASLLHVGTGDPFWYVLKDQIWRRPSLQNKLNLNSSLRPLNCTRCFELLSEFQLDFHILCRDERFFFFWKNLCTQSSGIQTTFYSVLTYYESMFRGLFLAYFSSVIVRFSHRFISDQRVLALSDFSGATNLGRSRTPYHPSTSLLCGQRQHLLLEFPTCWW